MQVRRAKLQPCGDNLSKKWQYFPGLPHFWGLLSLLFQLVLFLLLKTHVPVGIMEELSSNVRMIPSRDPGDIMLRKRDPPACVSALPLLLRDKTRGVVGIPARRAFRPTHTSSIKQEM